VARSARALAAGLLLLAVLPAPAAAANPWGDLKKIRFYEAGGDLAQVRRSLQRLDPQGLPPGDKAELLGDLVALGDRYRERGDLALAEAFYRKALAVSPRDAWPVYNALERLARRRGRVLWRFADVGRQFALVSRTFSGSFLLLASLFDVLLFSALLLFFMIAAALAVRYLKLAAHDFILEGRDRFQWLSLLILLLLLLWPLLLSGGWAIYPFLLCGVLWGYLNHDERVTVKRVQVLLLALACLYGVGQYLQRSLASPGFQAVQQAFAGRLFPAETVAGFDNELKVMAAYAHYHAGRNEVAWDILQDTGGAYGTRLKYTLMGDIQLERGNVPMAIQAYRQALRLDDKNPATLKNFTVALLRNNDPELFLFYGKSYPQINRYKDRVSQLQKEPLPESLLWRRLLRFSWQRFHFWHFLEVAAVEFLRFPVLLAMLAMAAYIQLLRRFSPSLGQSVFCSKCSKIIRKLSLEQTQSHALCGDCYQLFLIKDPIFLEAKLLKEKEIGRRLQRKQALLLGTSLLVPGFIMNFRGQNKAFALLFFLFASCFGLYAVNALNFSRLFGTVPMFLHLAGLAAVLLYLGIAVTVQREGPDGL
jgi:tetratricopeptide (TPR) repeat protein